MAKEDEVMQFLTTPDIFRTFFNYNNAEPYECTSEHIRIKDKESLERYSH
jgi:hypothetical protein